MNIEQILEGYKSHLNKTISQQRSQIAIRKLSPLYGCTPRDVAKHVENYINGRNASAGTINRELAVLQAAMRWSFKRGQIDFLPSIQRLPSPAPRSKFLTKPQVDALIKASVPYPETHNFIRIALMTGQRKEAILSLRWDQVDFNTGLVDFNDPTLAFSHRRKNRGIVPMSVSLRSLLTELFKQSDSIHVISRNKKKVLDFRGTWKKIMKASGLDITPHILRHTVATQLAQQNVPMPQISRLLGHKSTAITERVYAKYSPEFCRDAVSHLNV